MPELEAGTVTVVLDGREVQVPAGSTVAVALLTDGGGVQPVCGMGVCFRCNVEIDGVPHRRGCLVRCEPGMEVRRHG